VNNCAQKQKHLPRLEDIKDVQDDVRSQPNKYMAVQHMAEHYPHLSPNWIGKHLERLLSLDPEQLAQVIGYPDPTGETATNNVMKGAAA